MHVIASDAANFRPGYVDDVLSRGRIVGEWIEFDDEVYAELIAKYRGDAGGCKDCGG